MSGDSKSTSFSESLVLDDSAKGVVITGITDDTVAAKSGLQAGDEIVAATIHLDHLSKNEVLNILKVLEPYDNNIKVLTKKQLNASAGLGSLGLGLKDPATMLNLKKDLSMDASAEAPVFSLDGLSGNLNAAQGLGGEIGGPILNGDLPSLSLDKPSANAGSKFSMPSLGLTGPDIKGDLDGTFKAPDVSVSTPKLNTPSASLDIEKPGIKTGNLKHKAPKFAMPHFNLPHIKTPQKEIDVSGNLSAPSVGGNLGTPDLNLSAPKLDLQSPNFDLNGPKMDLNGPDINVETPNSDIEGGKIKWPPFKKMDWKLKGPKVKGPDTDLNADLSAPDFSLTTPKIDGDLSADDVDINLPKSDIKSPDLDVQTPNLDIDAPSGKFNWLHHKWKKPKFHGPKADLDLDANLNTPYVDPSLPKVGGEINAPDFDINLPKADLKGPDLDMQTPNIDIDAPSGKINWPHHKWKKPKLHGPNADLGIDGDLNTPNLNVSTPTIEGGIDVPKADLNGLNVDCQAPDLDIDGPSGKINWPHRKWKKPKLHGPKTDMDLNADLSTPDVDLSIPKIDGEISTPDVDLNLPQADVDVKAPEAGKIRFPTLKKPKFLLPKVKGPDVDLDADVKAPDLSLFPQASLDGPDIDLNLPKADVKAPNVDIEAQSGKFKWPTLRKRSVTIPKVNGPDADLDADLSAPNLSLTAPKIDGELNAPDVNLNLPKADLENINAPDVDGKFKWFNFKKPKFGTLRGPKGDIDADLKAPDINASLDLPKGDVDAPNVDLKASDLAFSSPKIGLDAPDLDINLPRTDLKGPEVDLQTPEVDASAGKFKLPKINFPKFGLSGPRVNGPDHSVDADGVSFPDLNLKLPTADAKAPNLNLSAPTIEGDLSTPDVDLDADLKTGIDLPTPKTNISVPDFSLSTPQTKIPHVNLNLPKAAVKGPSLAPPKPALQVPDLNLKAPDLSLSSPNIDGNLSAPNIDARFLKTELEAPRMDLNLPNGTDAQLKTPDLDFDSHLGDFNLPHFKLPKLGLSSPDVEIPSLHPSVEAGVEAPKVNIDAAMGDTKGLDAPNVDANLEKSKLSNLKFPKLNFLGNKTKAAEVNTSADLEFSPDVKVKVPSVEGEISSPDVSVSAPKVQTSLNTPELDLTTEAGAEVKGSPKSKLRWPFKWGLKSGSGTDEEESGGDSETDVSNADLEVPVFKIHRLPRNSIDGLIGIGDTLSLPKLDTDEKDYVFSKGIRLPIVNATSKAGENIDIMERLKMAKEKVPSANASTTEGKTDIDLNLASPSLDVGASSEADSSLVRGGTFKVDKPESVVNLVAPEISASDENDKLSLSLSNMLGLNI
ncbi:uncharacterized protein LOC141773714 [Sebastes fasciatus]|uniref:uncharacterized protein LOC141773714 n=1 Tax=Sebastes fasciatus TaxID=394691 RepID=UPI003D9F40B1